MAYAKPSSVTRTSTSGRASGSGVNYTVKGTSGYYVYCQDPSTYTYWRKGTLTSSGLSVNLGAGDTTSNSWTTCVILSSTDLGSSCTVSNEYSSYLYYVTVPKYIVQIYKGSSTLNTYDNCSQSSGDFQTILAHSSYDEVYGLTTSSSSNTPTIDAADVMDLWDSVGSTVNGKTYYAIYKKYPVDSTSTGYYYRGSNSKKSVTITTTTTAKYLYGKGTTSGGSTSTSVGSMTKTCLSDSSYSFSCWTTSPISSSGSGSLFAYAEDAFEESNTIYGIYTKAGGTTTSNAYYYRGTNSQKSVTKTTTTTDSEYYGTGQHIAGTTTVSYGTPTSSHASDTSWVFQGWATSSTSTSYSTSATTAWNSSNTIYGVYKKTGSSSNSNVYYYRGTNSQKTATKTTTIADSLCYGTGSTSGGETTYSYSTPTTTHETNSNYTFLGWATSANTYTSYNNNASTQWGSSNTIYGVYSKTDTMTYYPQNGASSNSASTTNYAYGTGSTTSNIPTEPTLTYDGYNFLGWATTSTGTENTWNNLWNNGNRTVYAIWKISTIPIQIHDGTKYVNYAVYIHNGTEYVKVIPYVHNGTAWKQLKSQ